MVNVCWLFYISKFIEMLDTVSQTPNVVLLQNYVHVPMFHSLVMQSLAWN